MRASSDTSPAAAGAKSCASSTTTSMGVQWSRSASNRPLRKAAAWRIWRLGVEPFEVQHHGDAVARGPARPPRQRRLRNARRRRSPDGRKRSASVTKSPSGSMIACCTQGAALFQQAAQQVRLAGAGIALHQQAGGEELLEVERRGPSGRGGGAEVDGRGHRVLDRSVPLRGLACPCAILPPFRAPAARSPRLPRFPAACARRAVSSRRALIACRLAASPPVARTGDRPARPRRRGASAPRGSGSRIRPRLPKVGRAWTGVAAGLGRLAGDSSRPGREEASSPLLGGEGARRGARAEARRGCRKAGSGSRHDATAGCCCAVRRHLVTEAPILSGERGGSSTLLGSAAA